MSAHCVYGKDFHEMHARLRGSNNISTLRQIKREPDVPSTANEIAEQRPDKNIKVTAFTVSKNFYHTEIF